MNIDKTDFLANLRLTQAYCAQQLRRTVTPSVAALRSLNPAYAGASLFRYEINTCSTNEGQIPPFLVEWQLGADPQDVTFIASIFKKQMLTKKAVAEGAAIKSKGEIILVEYDMNIPDGGAAVASEGFVDSQDFPPIDTWFYHVQNGTNCWLLFAWVPEVFIKQAQAAVDAQFLNIIHWFKEWAPADYRRLLDSSN